MNLRLLHFRTQNRAKILVASSLLLLSLFLAGCQKEEKVDEAKAAPPPAKVVEEPDLSIVKVDRPERFALVTVSKKEDVPQIRATGAVTPDVEKSVPIASLASGRVVDIRVRLGDDVKKGQLLLKILSNDLTSGFQTYNQAVADEKLAAKQLERAKILHEHGAISLNDLQVAQDVEEKAQVSVRASAQTIRTLGGDPGNDDAVLSVKAPVSGTVTEQNIVTAGAVAAGPGTNLFTISDLSTVWVLCDVYENDLPSVQVGDRADIELNAYPGRQFRGRVSNIGKVLDPNLRTAKVRIQLNNPGMMRSGMFVTATFYGQHGHEYASVPSAAMIHLHDRDWVFVPEGSGQFRRQEVAGGRVFGNEQEVRSGVQPGEKVVAQALALQAESEQ